MARHRGGPYSALDQLALPQLLNALARPLLPQQVAPDRVIRSSELGQVDDGVSVEVAGMVVAHQRPETAKGITFMLLEDERGTVNLIVPPPAYERCRTVVRASPLVRARGRLEHREGAVDVIVAELSALEWRSPSADAGRPTRVSSPAERHRLRELAVAELRAVAPTGHSFGRRS